MGWWRTLRFGAATGRRGSTDGADNYLISPPRLRLPQRPLSTAIERLFRIRMLQDPLGLHLQLSRARLPAGDRLGQGGQGSEASRQQTSHSYLPRSKRSRPTASLLLLRWSQMLGRSIETRCSER